MARNQHGPFERIVLTARDAAGAASLSVYRIGDLLIDTGGTRVAHALVDALRDDPPRRILCTHQHEDHVGGIGALRRAFGALPVYIAEPYLSLLASFDRVPDYRAHVWGTPEPVRDALGFLPGALFEAGGTTLRALETPGHTPFHITFVAHDSGNTYALTGDLYTSSPLVAWFESAADDLVRSCRLVAAESAGLQVLPTHGKAREAGAPLLETLADDVARHADSVRAHAHTAANEPQSYRELARALFGDGDAATAARSEGEISHANFVRSVLDPVRALPASPAR